MTVDYPSSTPKTKDFTCPVGSFVSSEVGFYSGHGSNSSGRHLSPQSPQSPPGRVSPVFLGSTDSSRGAFREMTTLIKTIIVINIRYTGTVVTPNLSDT